MFNHYENDYDNFRVYYKKDETEELFCIQIEGTRPKYEYNFYCCTIQGEPLYKIDFPKESEFDFLVWP